MLKKRMKKEKKKQKKARRKKRRVRRRRIRIRRTNPHPLLALRRRQAAMATSKAVVMSCWALSICCGRWMTSAPTRSASTTPPKPLPRLRCVFAHLCIVRACLLCVCMRACACCAVLVVCVRVLMYLCTGVLVRLFLYLLLLLLLSD